MNNCVKNDIAFFNEILACCELKTAVSCQEKRLKYIIPVQTGS
jgi:hypothetical protein